MKRIELVLLIIAALVMTLVGMFLAFAQYVEEPPEGAETLAIGTVALANSLWAIPVAKVHWSRGEWSAVRLVLLLFAVCWLPFVIMKFHDRPFDAEMWKGSLDHMHTYGDHPAHNAGYMVPDIIHSGILIGKARAEVEQLLGPHWFHERGMCDSCIAYFYNGKVLFDGCDKLLVRFESGICVGCGYGGCD